MSLSDKRSSGRRAGDRRKTGNNSNFTGVEKRAGDRRTIERRK